MNIPDNINYVLFTYNSSPYAMVRIGKQTALDRQVREIVYDEPADKDVWKLTGLIGLSNERAESLLDVVKENGGNIALIESIDCLTESVTQ